MIGSLRGHILWAIAQTGLKCTFKSEQGELKLIIVETLITWAKDSFSEEESPDRKSLKSWEQDKKNPQEMGKDQQSERQSPV